MNKKGFTLVEILAVITLLSLLIVFATTSGFGAFKKTKKSIDATQVKSIEEGFKILLVEITEENCVDYAGNPIYDDVKTLLGLSSTVDLSSCSKVRNYIGHELLSGPIDIELDNFLKTGYVVGSSLDDIDDSFEVTLQITGTATEITSPTGATEYEIDDDSLDYNFEYSEKDITGSSSEYVVEISVDYVTDKTLVIVYTNKENMGFTYNGTTLLNVSDSNYKYNNTQNYTYKYATLTDELSNNVLSEYESNVAKVEGVTLDKIDYTDQYDLNFGSGVNLLDVSVCYGVINLNEDYYSSTTYYKNIIKTDVNFDKKADSADCVLVSDNFKESNNLK